MCTAAGLRRVPRRRLATMVVLGVVALVALACGKNDGVDTEASPSTAARSSSSQPATADLEVKEAGFRAVSVQHWENGASLIDAAYIWGAVIDNPNQSTARDVTVEASFMRDGTVVETASFVVDEIPSGSFAVGSRPVFTSAEVDAISVTLEPAEFDAATGSSDRLVSPQGVAVAAADWKGEITVDAIDDPRALYTFIAYYGTDGKLIAVEPQHVDPTVLTPGTPAKVFVPAVPEGGAQVSEVRVFLARLSAPGDHLAPPTTTTASR